MSCVSWVVPVFRILGFVAHALLRIVAKALLLGAVLKLTLVIAQRLNIRRLGGLGGILEDAASLTWNDIRTLRNIAAAEISGGYNDSNMLQETLVQLAYKLPESSLLRLKVTEGFTRILWKGLPHPPSYLRNHLSPYRDPHIKSAAADLTRIGSPGLPYARTAVPILQQQNLPEPSKIFDALMAREGEFEAHPNRFSSMLFYLGIVITHDLFQTDPRDQRINLTSSYLDLSPLYGRNLSEQKLMRQFKDGLIKVDCISLKRVSLLPPGVGVLLIMFNRFHNYVAVKLADINEHGRFSRPTSGMSDSEATTEDEQRDEDLFQTARLITCGLYNNIIIRDYVRTLLSLNRTDSAWAVDPRARQHKTAFNTEIPHSTGNQVSIEFNLIYRWHSCLSQRDATWTENKFRTMLCGQEPAKANLGQMLRAMKTLDDSIPDAPEDRTFHGFRRGTDGRILDNQLVEELVRSVEDVAGAFGANSVPTALRSVEILGITQARRWHVATLNELRSYFGLSRHETFEDINPDPVVAAKLQSLYKTPDEVEMYPGMIAEKTKPAMSPGSGLCAGFTITRAILCDAVALVRSDRHVMDDWNPGVVTNWGFREVAIDLGVDNGCLAYKLILGAFPKSFETDSIYAHFPFVTPHENLKIMRSLGKESKYSFARPALSAVHTGQSLPKPI